MSLPSIARKPKSVCAALPRPSATTRDCYIHATFTSLIFRFVDDVEFVIDDSAKQIQFRSASRVGRNDFGVNRRRIEQLRDKLATS